MASPEGTAVHQAKGAALVRNLHSCPKSVYNHRTRGRNVRGIAFFHLIRHDSQNKPTAIMPRVAGSPIVFSMNRTRKLYERLDRLEEQFAALLRAELEAVLSGSLGNYLGSQLCDDWGSVMGRWQPLDARATDLHKSEAEILRLRKKLGEPIPGRVVGVARALVQRMQDAGESSPGCNKSWLRNAIVELTESK